MSFCVRVCSRFKSSQTLLFNEEEESKYFVGLFS